MDWLRWAIVRCYSTTVQVHTVQLCLRAAGLLISPRGYSTGHIVRYTGIRARRSQPPSRESKRLVWLPASTRTEDHGDSTGQATIPRTSVPCVVLHCTGWTCWHDLTDLPQQRLGQDHGLTRAEARGDIDLRMCQERHPGGWEGNGWGWGLVRGRLCSRTRYCSWYRDDRDRTVPSDLESAAGTMGRWSRYYI